MPFELCNAPATFQRLKEKVLGQLVNFEVLIYLDDVLLYAEDPELIELLRKVLKLLFNAGLKFTAKNCHLFEEEIHYFGHVVSRDGLKAESAKYVKIQQCPRHYMGTGLTIFLGLCNYYWTLVPSFADVTNSLYKASKLKVIEWTAHLSSTFDELKALMLLPPLVQLPDVDRGFILETDKSKVAVGEVLK